MGSCGRDWWFFVWLWLHSSSTRPHSWSLWRTLTRWRITIKGCLLSGARFFSYPSGACMVPPCCFTQARQKGRTPGLGIREGDRYVYIQCGHGQLQRLTRNPTGNWLKLKSVMNDSRNPDLDWSAWEWPEVKFIIFVIHGVQVTRMYVKDSRTGPTNKNNYLNRDKFVTPEWLWNLELWDRYLSSLVSKERLLHWNINLTPWVLLPQHPEITATLSVHWDSLMIGMCSSGETI